MPNIRKSLLQFIFSGVSMKRWNDKLRPTELVEVDKQAHKMIAAWVLLIQNSKNLSQNEQLQLTDEVIFGGIADYLYRLVITDIKPPIFYKIKSNLPEYRRLTQWVLDSLVPLLQPLGQEFWKRLEDYFSRPRTTLSTNILAAAHTYASRWEFLLLQGMPYYDEEMAEIKTSFERSAEQYSYLIGMPEISAGSKTTLGRFVHLCGQLRFQKRWSQTPRIPETSVLGHMFLVACYAWFFGLSLGYCRAGMCNNFFTGLFHDIPELLTRDIISPVKSSSPELQELVRRYEEQEMKEKILNPLRNEKYFELVDKMEYFLGLKTGSEFDTVICKNKQIEHISRHDLQQQYNFDEYNPKDGEMVKVCDNLAAFIEAYAATSNGISNMHLYQAQWRIREQYRNFSLSDNLHIGALLADFA